MIYVWYHQVWYMYVIIKYDICMLSSSMIYVCYTNSPRMILKWYKAIRKHVYKRLMFIHVYKGLEFYRHRVPQSKFEENRSTGVHELWSTPKQQQKQRLLISTYRWCCTVQRLLYCVETKKRISEKGDKTKFC